MSESVSQQQQIDLKEVVQTHELSAVLLAYATPDGEIYRTGKSQLLKELEKIEPSITDIPKTNTSSALIIDVMPFIRQLLKKEEHSTVGDLCDTVLRRLVTLSVEYREIHVVFDRYDTPLSIKENERERRAKDGGIEVYISSLDTPFIQQMSKFWAVSSNKAQLCEHVSVYIRDHMTDFPDERTIFLAGGFHNGETVLKVSNSSSEPVKEYFSTQEEADTRLILHIKEAANRYSNSIVVWSSDTDVVVLSIYFFKFFKVRSLWVKVKHRYFDIIKLVTKLL